MNTHMKEMGMGDKSAHMKGMGRDASPSRGGEDAEDDLPAMHGHD